MIDLKFFNYSYLPSYLQEHSKPFYELAWWMAKTLPDNDERNMALRKLLEAKDCAIRSNL